MLRVAARFDAAVASSRFVWIGLGQLAVVILGVHVAADRLDDLIAGGLSAMPLPWPNPDAPITVAAWIAIALELLVVMRAALALTLTQQDPELDWNTWKKHLSVDALVLPLFWFPVALAGAWVAGLAVEDVLSPYQADVAAYAGWIVAAIVGWRLGFTGWKRVVGGLDLPKKRTEGWPMAIPLLIVAGVAFRHGLPIWGWL